MAQTNPVPVEVIDEATGHLIPKPRRPDLKVVRTSQFSRQGAAPIAISFEVHPDHAPALRSVVEEMSNIIGTRLEAPHAYDKEAALTNAALVMGILRRAVNQAIPAGDPHYA